MNTYVIAEAGVNHNGSREMAFSLVDTAVASGADAVKFQTFTAANLVTHSAPKAEYQKRTTDSEESQFAMLKQLELSPELHRQLQTYCRKKGIDFLSTAFDQASLALLRSLSLPRYKIPSGEITNGPLLWHYAQTQRPLILSTGLSNLGEIEQALCILAHGLLNATPPASMEEAWAAYYSEPGQQHLASKVTLLHCTTQYPTPPQSVNLRAMDTLAQAFNLPVGWSDHTQGIHIPIAAVARGARLIEKHFTLDRQLPGPDHQASLEPSELKAMISAIRDVETALGTGAKHPQTSEMANRQIARQVLVAATQIQAGEPLREHHLTTRRAGKGISPMRYWDLLNRPASRGYRTMEPLDE